MFHDLDETLRTLLKGELPSELAQSVHVTFGPPDSGEITSGNKLPALNLFLYDIKEDVSRRVVRPDIERRADGTVTRHWPPAIVDCHYLITAWSGAEGEAKDFDEHRLLGEAMKAFLRHREIPKASLRGELKVLDHQVTAWLIQSDRVKSLGEFWQALGGKPRAALSYMVTIQVPTTRPEPAGTVATELEV